MSPPSERTLLAALNERGPIRVTSLSSALDAHPIAVDQRCYDLQSEGHVRRVSGEVYEITDDGQERLKRLAE
jgi:Mn-dependent DtxR family transcriptional regulator